jgi:septal ring factor EnvC (AmiA/AmiB activator)
MSKKVQNLPDLVLPVEQNFRLLEKKEQRIWKIKEFDQTGFMHHQRHLEDRLKEEKKKARDLEKQLQSVRKKISDINKQLDDYK